MNQKLRALALSLPALLMRQFPLRFAILLDMYVSKQSSTVFCFASFLIRFSTSRAMMSCSLYHSFINIVSREFGLRGFDDVRF